MNLYRKIRNRFKLQKRYKKWPAQLKRCGIFSEGEIDGRNIVKVGDLNLANLFEGDGVLIAEEIFSRGEYHFDIAGKAVVIDIGMNIGLASLYFASRTDVEAVYGFEPFKPTVEQAKVNFSINGKYSCKIHPLNCGLGSSDKQK